MFHRSRDRSTSYRALRTRWPLELVKIDTEGAEADILEGARPQTLKAIRQFVIEYHDALCSDELCSMRARIGNAGFHCIARPRGPLGPALRASSCRPTPGRAWSGCVGCVR